MLRRADLLVSDFSGVIFDFTLVFDKPVIYADTKFDKSPYDCWWLDTPYWTFEILPQIGQQLTEDNFDTLAPGKTHDAWVQQVNECMMAVDEGVGRVLTAPIHRSTLTRKHRHDL